jgi:hypothetical protein
MIKDLDVTQCDHYIGEINKSIQKLERAVNIEERRVLEHNLLYLGLEIAKLKRVNLRSKRLLEIDKNRAFLEERKKTNSDRTATSKVNKDYINEISSLEIWEEIVEYFEETYKCFLRIANFYNQEQIEQNVQSKRQAGLT